MPQMLPILWMWVFFSVSLLLLSGVSIFHFDVVGLESKLRSSEGQSKGVAKGSIF